MMRQVVEFQEEIYNLDGNKIDKYHDFIDYIPEKFKPLCKVIKHVDTRLRLKNGEKYWRVQGYINIDGLQYLLEYYPESPKFDVTRDMMINFSRGQLEIWSLSVPYTE